ncbi:hypothetical protein ACJX0J_025656, partial [Zea mays]
FLSYNIMVSKPVVLVFLLVVLIITSQFEWKQQLVNELESTARNQKHVSSREELVKDQIIFTQEKMIQRLNNFVRNLQQQYCDMKRTLPLHITVSLMLFPHKILIVRFIFSEKYLLGNEQLSISNANINVQSGAEIIANINWTHKIIYKWQLIIHVVFLHTLSGDHGLDNFHCLEIN